jgi:uncharacterized sodium:solute symporter family permease YidK
VNVGHRTNELLTAVAADYGSAVRTARTFLAGSVVGIAIVGAVWLYTYRAHELVRFVDANGIEYHDPRSVSVQAWWSVYAALALLVVAAIAVVRLLPNGVTTVKRLARFLARQPEQPTTSHR